MGIYCNWYPGYFEGRATVLLGHADATNKADGTFTAQSTSYLGYGYHTSAVVGDFLGDGGLDFAAVGFDQWTVSVLEGDGQGNLFGPYVYSAGAYPWSLAAGDVNGDSRADLAAANRYGNDVSVLLGAARRRLFGNAELWHRQ